jgi:transposase
LQVSGLKFERQSVCALSNHKRFFEPMIYTGKAYKELILGYFKYTLPKLLPNSKVLMNNASWHKSKELQDFLNFYDVEQKFQAPYIPETNPLEKLWGLFKELCDHIMII